MIQKPQKEHLLKAYAKASLKNHEERKKRAKENQLCPGQDNFVLFGITSENCKN